MMETVVDVPKTEAEVLESMKARWNALNAEDLKSVLYETMLVHLKKHIQAKIPGLEAAQKKKVEEASALAMSKVVWADIACAFASKLRVIEHNQSTLDKIVEDLTTTNKMLDGSFFEYSPHLANGGVVRTFLLRCSREYGPCSFLRDMLLEE